MSFMTNSPISTAKLESSPPLPIEGARGLFSMSDGWYDIDDNGNVKKIVDADISSTALGEGATALGLQNIAGCLGYYFTDIDFEHNRIVLSKEQGVSPTESFDIKYKVNDVISINYDMKYLNCSTIIGIDRNVITVDSLPFPPYAYGKDNPGINDFALYDVNNPLAGEVPITESSFAGGKECKALDALSIAIGNKNIATGYNAIALGRNTKALNWQAYAEGLDTTASGGASHAEGGETIASGTYSHAEGYITKAESASSHAEGKGTVARGEASHAQGKYNIEDIVAKYAHIVGNGKSDIERSNAHTLDWNGNAWFAESVEAPTIYTNQVVLLSSNNKKFALKVSDDGTLYTEEVSK